MADLLADRLPLRFRDRLDGRVDHIDHFHRHRLVEVQPALVDGAVPAFFRPALVDLLGGNFLIGRHLDTGRREQARLLHLVERQPLHLDVRALDQRQQCRPVEQGIPGIGLATRGEPARLQSLRPDPVTVTVEGENLQHRPVPIKEQNLMSARRIRTEVVARHGELPVKRAPHVRRRCAQPDATPAIQVQHDPAAEFQFRIPHRRRRPIFRQLTKQRRIERRAVRSRPAQLEPPPPERARRPATTP